MKNIAIILITLFSLLGCKENMVKVKDMMSIETIKNMISVKKYINMPQVRSIQLSSFSAADKQAVFEVGLYNPNTFQLPLSGLSGQISLNQVPIGSVEAKSDSSLPAQAVQLVAIPISFDPNAFIEAAKSVVLQRKASYQFNGEASTPIGSIPFTNEGKLSVQDIMSTILR